MPIGHLRTFVILMVVAHHTMLAYHPYAPDPVRSLVTEPRWWLAFPVVDHARSAAFLVLVSFDDIFGMALMFFLSGLFVWRSYERRGTRTFLRDRFARLGVPFALAALLLGPLAYYPAYLRTTAGPSVADFARVWRSLGTWPSGPPWFLWVLLAFDVVAAAIFALAPSAPAALARVSSDNPAAFFRRLVVVSAIVYVPVSLALDPAWWSSFGPFTVQTSRVLLYLVYFLAGAGIGIAGVDRGFFDHDGTLAREWAAWILRALGAYGLAAVGFLAPIAPERWCYGWGAIRGLTFVLSCATSTLCVLALFVRFARTRTRVSESLRVNAYGIFLVHFPFVNWLGYAMLPFDVPAVLKGAIVFIGTTTCSWATAVALRRVPAVARVL